MGMMIVQTLYDREELGSADRAGKVFFFLAFLCGNYFLARFLVLKVGKLFNVLRGKEKLGYTDDDLSPGQQPPSEQAARQRSEYMYVGH